MAYSSGTKLKKKYGQHFLHDQSIVDFIVNYVSLNDETSVFEIGGGEGFLTKTILRHPCKQLWVFEIDPEWVHVLQKINDKRLTVYGENFLDIDFSIFEADKPWTLLANLPYQVTFPILKKLQKNRHLLKEGVIMVQEEVAQKIVKTKGRGYGFISLFFQHYFEWALLQKIHPSAFYPPPKVYSRLLYFKPKEILTPIPDEPEFWRFIKVCFAQPRRTLRNNLIQAHYALDKIPEEYLSLRSQQLGMKEFLKMWDILRPQ